ncbi:MAG: cytidylate kinase-like family protein [Lachnospiraceae bacterium]|jgi:cytidylate kinase|nr:cytidylate kinase-like family protein [Lachnospiraceae bacterium]
MGNFVITIGRQFGSGGLDIGRKLSEKLNVKCYDKELLAMAAKESGLCQEIFENHDEKPTNSFLYSLVMDTYSVSGYTSAPFLDMPLNHKVFLAQFETIKKLADQESCIIVGRCADYALTEHSNCLNVFIHADKEFRINHIMDTFHLSHDKAADMIHKTDKKRASYYNYYSSKKWGDARSYHLTLDSSHLGLEGCCEMILSYMKLRKN